MNSTHLVSWDLPALLSDGSPSSDSRAKSRRRHHQEYLAETEKMALGKKPPVKAAPRADAKPVPQSPRRG